MKFDYLIWLYLSRLIGGSKRNVPKFSVQQLAFIPDVPFQKWCREHYWNSGPLKKISVMKYFSFSLSHSFWWIYIMKPKTTYLKYCITITNIYFAELNLILFRRSSLLCYVGLNWTSILNYLDVIFESTSNSKFSASFRRNYVCTTKQ